MNSREKKERGAIYTGIIAALAASSCCIPPVISAVAGVAGISSTLSWMEPLRPYLIILTVFAIGYTWYPKLRPVKEDDCGCSVKKAKWYQSTTFLIGMTLFATLSLSFPYYSSIFFKATTEEVIKVGKHESILKYNVDGMTCTACELHLSDAGSQVEGVSTVNASYKAKHLIVVYDSSTVSDILIQRSIQESTGYILTPIKHHYNER